VARGAAVPGRKPLRIAWEGHSDGVAQGSWALVNRRLRPFLERQIDVDFIPPRMEFDSVVHDVWVTHYFPGLEEGQVAWQIPPVGSRKWVVYLAWEHGPIPPAWENVWRLGRVAEVWVPSQHTRRLVLASTGLDPAKVAVMPYGVDTSVYRPDQPPWPAESNAFRVLYVGGPIWRKGADLAMQAYCEAFTGAEPTRLVLKLQGLRSFYRDAPAIRAPLGRIDYQVLQRDDYTDAEMAGLMTGCDVLVAPYRAEGFALAVLEAMACGLPVVYPAYGPAPEYVPADAGIAVPLEKGEPDVVAVARALRFLWRHPDHRRAMGHAGRQDAARYDWACAADRIVGRLLWVAESRDKGDAFSPPPSG
jgi:glycosyltransferase involved in cell wall biosynthesis